MEFTSGQPIIENIWYHLKRYREGSEGKAHH